MYPAPLHHGKSWVVHIYQMKCKPHLLPPTTLPYEHKSPCFFCSPHCSLSECLCLSVSCGAKCYTSFPICFQTCHTHSFTLQLPYTIGYSRTRANRWKDNLLITFIIQTGEAREKDQWVKTLATKPGGLGLIPTTHMVGEEK